MGKKTKIVALLVVVAAILGGGIAYYVSYSNHKKVLTEASEALSTQDYVGTLETILKLDDSKIMADDSLMNMLATAYYGLNLKSTKNIALNCGDMDLAKDETSIYFTDLKSASINEYSYPSMEFIRSINLPYYSYAIDISPDGKSFAAAIADGTILVYDLKTGKPRTKINAHNGPVRDVVYKDNNLLFSCSNDHYVAAWNIPDGQPSSSKWGISEAKQYASKKMHTKNIKSLQLSKDGTMLITASNDGSSHAIKADANLDDISVFPHGDNYVNDAAITKDNKYAVTVSGDSIVKIWNITTQNNDKRIKLPASVCSIDINDDGIALIGGDKHAYFVDLKEGKIIATVNTNYQPIWKVKFMGANDFIMAGQTQFYCGRFLTGDELISAARETYKRFHKD